MAKYYVKSLVTHNGQDYLPGGVIDLKEADATPLLKVGAILTEEQFNEVKVANTKEADFAQAVADRDGEIQSLKALLEQRNESIKTLEAAIAEQDKAIAELNDKLKAATTKQG